MKQNIFFRVIVAIAMMLIGWLPSLAHDFEVDGVFYKKTSDNAVAVTYKGYSYDSYPNEYAGDVVIPSSVNYNGITYSVTSIGYEAFKYCSSLTSVVIGNGVTSIGGYAFYECSSLTSIQIPNSVTSIGNYAFYSCESLTSIQIPHSVTSIGDDAFSRCSGLTNIQIPNSVTSIGDSAFSHCTSLTNIQIPNSVTSIGDSAFSGCSGLKTVVFYCPSVSLGSWTHSSNIDLVFLGGEIKEVGSNFPSSKYLTFYVSPSKVEIFRQKFYGHTVKEITTEQIAIYCNSEKVSNEYDVEKSGTVSFSGSGSGTESDPFLIFNPVQLNDVRNSVGHSGVYYKLMSDIDMTEWIAENNPQQGWQPIGNLSSMFKGTFIGNGKKLLV